MGITLDATAQPAGFRPEDHGLLEWTYEPATASASTTLATAGTLYLAKLRVRQLRTITNIHINVSTAGSVLTAGQCFAALFGPAKTLLAVTADQAAVWDSTGEKTMALSAPQQVAAGYCWAGLWFNGTTGPTLSRSTALNAFQANFNLALADCRWTSADTGLTTTAPAEIGTQSRASASLWVGLS